MSTESTLLEDRETKQRLETICKEADFPLSQVRQEGDVLVLIPETLSSLPSSDGLQALSDRIQEFGFRYVAFSVEAET